MAELRSETFTQVAPNAGMKVIWATGLSVNNGDIITVTDLTIVKACFGFATDGTAAAYSITGDSNIITVLNGGTKTWNFLVIGV